MYCFGNRHENLHRWDFVHRPPLCSLRFPSMSNKQTLYHRITRNHYKPRDAHVVRLATFLMVLRNRHKSSPSVSKVVYDTFKIIKRVKKIADTRLYEVLTKHEVRSAWECSQKIMVEAYEVENTRVAEDGEKACSICMDKVGDYVSAHGATAHGGICGACALRLVMQPHPKCPFCSQKIRMIAARSRVCAGGLKIFDP